MRRAIVAAIGLAFSACATTVPLSSTERWEKEVHAYQEQLERFSVEAGELLEGFEALRAEPSFASLEAKIKGLSARAAKQDTTDSNQLTVAALYRMTLGELLLFPRFLALSTRWVTLEATKSELERVRLNLRARRIALDRQPSERVGIIQIVSLGGNAPSVVERPVTAPWSCAIYVVGSLAFANCSPQIAR